MNEILIAVGSNIAKEANVPAAVAHLDAQPGITVLGVSTVLETPAIGADGQPASQPSYHNVGLRAATTLDLPAVRRMLREIETELGRVRGKDKFAPRTIDLDLVYYGERRAAETTGAGELPLAGGIVACGQRRDPVLLAEVPQPGALDFVGLALERIARRVGAGAAEAKPVVGKIFLADPESTRPADIGRLRIGEDDSPRPTGHREFLLLLIDRRSAADLPARSVHIQFDQHDGRGGLGEETRAGEREEENRMGA